MKPVIQTSVIPFTSEIVGATPTYVYLKEIYWIEDGEESNYCLLKVKRSDFNKMIKIWLDSKAGFTKRYDHFCGVFGNFQITEHIQEGETNLLTGFDEVKEDVIYEQVPIFKVLAFDPHCDMEHG